MSVSLVSSFLPVSLIDYLQGPGEIEQPMCSTSLLIVNIALKAIEALNKSNFKAFDANPGDRGCQNLAFELRRLSAAGLPSVEEKRSLEETAFRIKDLVKERMNSEKQRNKCSALLFFKSHLVTLVVSKEMEYILHCYLSTVLRTPYKTLETGVVVTRSDVSKFEKLSPKIDSRLKGGFPNEILKENQKNLSKLSMESIRASAMRLSTLKTEEKDLLMTMLSKENTHIVQNRTFGCSFYGIKTVLFLLREERGVICLKSIVPKGSLSFRIFLRAQEIGGEFTVLSEEAFGEISSDTAIMVFEVEVKMNKEETSRFLMEHGLTDMLLFQASEEALYEPGTELDKIIVPDGARKEILECLVNRFGMHKVLTVDHVYFNTLGGEL